MNSKWWKKVKAFFKAIADSGDSFAPLRNRYVRISDTEWVIGHNITHVINNKEKGMMYIYTSDNRCFHGQVAYFPEVAKHLNLKTD